MRIIKWISAVVLALCGLTAWYLAILIPSRAGGRGGLLVTGVIFLVFAFVLVRRKRS
jgi:hypothetical protein